MTAVTRPGNLKAIHNSMWRGYTPGLKIRWIVIADGDEDVSLTIRHGTIKVVTDHFNYPSTGHAQMNLALDRHVEPGWVYRLDDDNMMHPDFIDTFLEYVRQGHYQGMVFGQVRAKDGYVAPDIRYIDSGQFVLHTNLIGDTRWGLHYTADGDFFRDVYDKNEGAFLVTEKACTYHNRLREWGNWDE